MFGAGNSAPLCALWKVTFSSFFRIRWAISSHLQLIHLVLLFLKNTATGFFQLKPSDQQLTGFQVSFPQSLEQLAPTAEIKAKRKKTCISERIVAISSNFWGDRLLLDRKIRTTEKQQQLKYFHRDNTSYFQLKSSKIMALLQS